MIAEIIIIVLAVQDCNTQWDKVAQATTEQIEYADITSLAGTPSLEDITVIHTQHKSYDAQHYRYLSKRHTDMAITRTAHKRVIYWKRIRSRTWKKKNTFRLEALTIILIVIVAI